MSGHPEVDDSGVFYDKVERESFKPLWFVKAEVTLGVMEELHSVVTDRFVLSLINKKSMEVGDG